MKCCNCIKFCRVIAKRISEKGDLASVPCNEGSWVMFSENISPEKLSARQRHEPDNIKSYSHPESL
jgi:hypothetical protein